MNKIFCIDEAKIFAREQKERVTKNIFQLDAKMKRANKRIRDLDEGEKEKNIIRETLYKKIKDSLIKYGKQEMKKFDQVKSHLTNELIANRDLIEEYKYSIDEFRKDYKAEDIDASKVEQQILTLEGKIEELKEMMNSEKNELKGLYFLDADIQNLNSAELLNKENDVFRSAISSYAEKLSKYEDDLYEYKAIKVISLLGKSTPEAKRHQYENAIKKVQNEFRMGTAINFLEDLEAELDVDKEPIEEKTSKLQKAKNTINSIKSSTPLQAITSSPTMQEAKGIVSTIENVCTNIIKNSPELQAIVDAGIKLEDKIKDNLFDLIYLANENDLAFDASTYSKTDSETYKKATADKKAYNSHNTVIKKMNTEEGRKELLDKINVPYILTSKVKKLLRLRKFEKSSSKKEVYTEKNDGMLNRMINKAKSIKQNFIWKKDKFGYSTQKKQNIAEKMISKQQNQQRSKTAHLATPEGYEL